jgi:hypothetical protein
MIVERLPDPYMPSWPYLDEFPPFTPLTAATATWPSANRAIFVPFFFPVSATIYSINFWAGNGTGNYDLGLYTEALERIASSGSTAMSAAGNKSLLLGEYRLGAGKKHHAALALSSASGQAMRLAAGVGSQLAVVQVGQQASALPLPATATPAIAASAYCPVFTFGVR